MRLRTSPGDRGATALAYAALLLIGAAMLGTIWVLVSGQVRSQITIAVCQMFNGKNCTPPPFDYKPSTGACILSSNSKKVGMSVTVFSVKVGQNFQAVKIRTADGKVRVMIVPIDYKLGAEAKIGAGATFGKNTYGLNLGAKVEGAVNLKYGDTWVFNNDHDASDFLDTMKGDLLRKTGESVSPLLWAWDKVSDWKPHYRDPDVNQFEVGVEGALKGSAAFGNLETGDDGKKSVTDIGTGAEIEGRAGDGIIVTNDNSGPKDKGFPTTSYTFQVKGSIKGAAKVVGYGVGGEAAYTGQTKVTFDNQGRLKSITWVTTQETNLSENIKNPGKKTASPKNTDKQISTTTTTVNFDDSNRAIGQQWLHDNAFLMPFQTIRNAADKNGGFVAQDPGPNASAMDRLLYDKGIVNRNVYDGISEDYKLGLEGGDVITFGIEGGYEGEKQKLADAQYLGPPENGRRTFQTWPECAPR
ncbi:hypothetical protein AB0L06_00320 [Spirillospora sp. NPDC052269]